MAGLLKHGALLEPRLLVSAMTTWPNQSPEPTPIGALSDARTPVEHRVLDSGWLSFGR